MLSVLGLRPFSFEAHEMVAKLLVQFFKTGVSGLFVIAIMMTFASGADAKTRCYTWSKAKSVIEHNKLRRPSAVRKQTIRAGNEVISMELCRKKSRYIYRLKVIGRKKRARNLVIDAGSGAKIGGKSIKNYINGKKIKRYVKSAKFLRYIKNRKIKRLVKRKLRKYIGGGF